MSNLRPCSLAISSAAIGATVQGPRRYRPAFSDWNVEKDTRRATAALAARIARFHPERVAR